MKRIPAIIALFLAVPLIAQTAKPTVPPTPPAVTAKSAPQLSDYPNYISIGTTVLNFADIAIDNTTKGGCSQVFGRWDAKRHLCKGVIQFEGMGRVSCSRGSAHNVDKNMWVVTCWYTPKPKEKK